MMAGSAADAPSTHAAPLQIAALHHRMAGAIERWLEAERDQLPLWLPVTLGGGMALWFAAPDPAAWGTMLCGFGGAGLALMALARFGRLARVLGIACLMIVLGIAVIWARATLVAAPVLAAPVVVTMEARVVSVTLAPARALERLVLAPDRAVAAATKDDPAPLQPLPPRIRVNLAVEDVPAGLGAGARISLRARLLPPAGPALPGAYDYARVAWFGGIGATGRAFAPVTVLTPAPERTGGLRDRLSRHIRTAMPGGPGAIAAALAAGDQGAIPVEDAEAMRRAGLAHLLSVSGLHITAVVGATMLLVLRLLALSPWLALRVRLPLVAAGAGALAAIGYTILTGAEVPTVRSCIAALLVVAAIMLGREALTLRLVAAGALVVLLIVPEALAGPSFQLSFAAVATIIALHEHQRVRAWLAVREEPWWRRAARQLTGLLLTGVVVEAALAPIALYHFHKAGLYGALANIVAIPLTTFVVMPAEALALMLDGLGLGWPAWRIAEAALGLLLWIAHATAGLPGAVTSLPAMPPIAFALIIGGGLWVLLWRTRWRWMGLAPAAIGALIVAVTPGPDILITGDGTHVAVRLPSGRIAMLRDRTGDYNRTMLSELAGIDEEPDLIADAPDAQCSVDSCAIDLPRKGRRWRLLATRSAYRLPIAQLQRACAAADIVVSDRRLPRTCRPRWIKLDAPVLRRTGGVAIVLDPPRWPWRPSSGPGVSTVRHPGDAHPWRTPPLIGVSRSGATSRRASPGSAPGAGGSAGDRRNDWRDRAAPSFLRDGNI